MKKTYKLIDLDCANGAAKMETAIQKIDGVTSATVSFMIEATHLYYFHVYTNTIITKML